MYRKRRSGFNYINKKPENRDRDGRYLVHVRDLNQMCNIESMYVWTSIKWKTLIWKQDILLEKGTVANIGCSFWNDGNVRQLAFLPFKKIANFTEFFFAFINVLNIKEVSIYCFMKISSFSNWSYTHIKVIKYSWKRDYWVFREPCRFGKFYVEFKMLLS